MSHVLAEVADKVPSPATFWAINSVIALIVFALSILGRWRAAGPLVILSFLWVALSVHLALAPDPISDAAVEELGSGYLLNQVVAPHMPVAAACLGVMLPVRPKRRRAASPTR